MIKDVLRDLTPKVEAIKTHKIEEEGSSSIPGDKDNEGDNVDVDDQNEVSPNKQSEHQAIIQTEEQTPIQVKDSNPKREHIKETTPT